MSDQIKNLITLIDSGKTAEAQAAFSVIVSEKRAQALEVKKISMTSKIYGKK